jgi:hypothetical protein
MNDGVGGIFCPLQYPAPHQTGWGWSASSSAYWGTGDDTNPSQLVGGKSPGAFAPNGTGAILDPIYVWGNTGTETSDPGYVGTQTYCPDNCSNNMSIDGEVADSCNPSGANPGIAWLEQGRDYYVNVAKPGWTSYAYPHPLHAAFASGNPPSTPASTPTPTPASTPTPTPAAPQDLRVVQ